MDTPDLAALVPVHLAGYPHFRWTVTDPRAEVLRLTLHPRSHPDRLATIEVNPGAEVYLLTFMGHDAGHEFAYTDEDKRDALASIVGDAVALASGPTRVTRRLVDDVQISCEVLVDAGGPHERSLGKNVSNPVSYLKARLKGRPITEQVTTLPPIRSV